MRIFNKSVAKVNFGEDKRLAYGSLTLTPVPQLVHISQGFATYASSLLDVNAMQRIMTAEERCPSQSIVLFEFPRFNMALLT
jgi:hypothetical protein